MAKAVAGFAIDAIRDVVTKVIRMVGVKLVWFLKEMVLNEQVTDYFKK